MITKFADTTKIPIRGHIKLGAEAIKANCGACGHAVEAIKPYSQFICPTCDSPVVPNPGEKQYTKATPYFILPEEIVNAGIYPERPDSILVVPAYPRLNDVIPNSYSKYVTGKRLFCRGNGVTAKRYDKIKRGTVDFTCSDSCPDRKDGSCKLTGSFYVILPDFDLLSAYALYPKSEQSIENIISSLKRVSNRDGVIANAAFTLKIAERERKTTKTKYFVLELVPPRLSIEDYRKLTGQAASNLIGYDLHAGKDKVTPSHVITGEGAPEVVNLQADDETLKKGRATIREMAKRLIKTASWELALESYVTLKYGVAFEVLTIDQLREIFNDVKNDKEALDQFMHCALEQVA